MRFFSILLLIGWFNGYAQTPVTAIKITELQDYLAKSDHPLIVSFWATFCAPCIKEIPYLQSTAARYQDQEVELILVSLDHADHFPSRIGDFAKKQGYTVKLLWLNE